MKELQVIIDVWEELKRSGKTAVLATIVAVRGSTYRHPGARLLMSGDRQMVGLLSGGCLEADLAERARDVLASGDPTLVTYDLSSVTDIVWGLGLGCNGTVQVLIERLPSASGPDPLAFVADCLRRKQVGVLATLFCVNGQVNGRVGARLMLHPDHPVTENLGDAELADAILADAQEALQEGRSAVKVYQLSRGHAEVFIEVVQPPVSLVLFGGGPDAVPVVRLAKELGWHVAVVDHRPAYATRDRFPHADAVVLSPPEEVPERLQMDARTVAVVMTHHYLHDLGLLKRLLPTPIRYLGVVGPKSRTERLLEELRAQGIVPAGDQLTRLYGPAGLDIGPEAPEQIALAIVAEIQAVLAGRAGGSLRDRKGPIHDRMMASHRSVSPEKAER